MSSVTQPLPVRPERYWLATGAPSAAGLKEEVELNVADSPSAAACGRSPPKLAPKPCTSPPFFSTGETISQPRESSSASGSAWALESETASKSPTVSGRAEQYRNPSELRPRPRKSTDLLPVPCVESCTHMINENVWHANKTDRAWRDAARAAIAHGPGLSVGG